MGDNANRQVAVGEDPDRFILGPLDQKGADLPGMHAARGDLGRFRRVGQVNFPYTNASDGHEIAPSAKCQRSIRQGALLPLHRFDLLDELGSDGGQQIFDALDEDE